MLTAIIALLGIIISSLSSVIITKNTLKKRQPLIDAQVAKISVETLTKVLEAQKQENKEVVTQLRTLKNETSKLRKAIEKVGTCPHAANCPVADELQDGKKHNTGANEHNA